MNYIYIIWNEEEAFPRINVSRTKFKGNNQETQVSLQQTTTHQKITVNKFYHFTQTQTLTLQRRFQSRQQQHHCYHQTQTIQKQKIKNKTKFRIRPKRNTRYHKFIRHKNTKTMESLLPPKTITLARTLIKEHSLEIIIEWEAQPAFIWSGQNKTSYSLYWTGFLWRQSLWQRKICSPILKTI